MFVAYRRGEESVTFSIFSCKRRLQRRQRATVSDSGTCLYCAVRLPSSPLPLPLADLLLAFKCEITSPPPINQLILLSRCPAGSSLSESPPVSFWGWSDHQLVSIATCRLDALPHRRRRRHCRHTAATVIAPTITNAAPSSCVCSTPRYAQFRRQVS